MLPRSLLELVSLRFSTQLTSSRINVHFRAQIRPVQQLATKSTSSPFRNVLTKATYTQTSNTTSGDHMPEMVRMQEQIRAVSDLEARVADLKESIQTSEPHDSSLFFEDATLLDIYKDLLAYHDPSPSQEASPLHPVKVPVGRILRVFKKRLSEIESALNGQANGLANRLQARVHPDSARPVQGGYDYKIDLNSKFTRDASKLKRQHQLRELIIRLRAVLDNLRSGWSLGERQVAPHESGPTPFGVLTLAEWNALSRACVQEDDPYAAEAVVELMKSVDLPLLDKTYNDALNWYAERGRINDADAHVAEFGLDTPNESQRDLLVKARLKAGQIDKASALLHSFETRNTPAPMISYTRVIQALLQRRGPGSSQHAAQAWDLFAHMRYVAHPIPDAFLYSTMIRASFEPERALDLFTEMTVEQRIAPDTYAYTAVIRACARSKKFALHAFRLAREMLDSHRDAEGSIPPHLRPDVHLFLGLLDAAKRIGDLARARWVFAQMVQGMRDTEKGQLVYVDQKALTHMFHAYAAYQPPFHRRAVPVLKEQESQEAPEVDQFNKEDDWSSQTRNIEVKGLPAFLGLPQTHREIAHEATMLWERVMQDRQVSRDSDAYSSAVFNRVRVDCALVNAYLMVHYAHSPPSESYQLYNTIYDGLGIERDAFAHVLALEAYAKGGKVSSPHEKQVVLSQARIVWESWLRLERDSNSASLYDARSTAKVEPRLVERAWCAMMRLLSLSGNDDEAGNLLHRFVQLYPPKHVKSPLPPDPYRSNRTRLYDERPLVRLIEPSTVPDDRLPPFLTFTDVALLHSRALEKKNRKLLDFIKWAVCAYDGSLRYRRQAQLRQKNIS